MKKAKVVIKRLLVIIACIILFGVMVDGFPALAYQPVVSVTIDGEAVVFEGQEPMIVSGRVLVPVRGVFLDLGFDIEWDRITSSAILTRCDYKIVITIGSTYFYLNGASYNLDVPAQLIYNRVMLPIRFVLESIGYTVTWNASNREAAIMTGGVNQLDNDGNRVNFEELFVLTISAEETSLQSGNDFTINVELNNISAKNHEIYFSILFWPFIPGWEAMQGVVIDPPEDQPRLVKAGGVLTNVHIWGEDGEPWLLGSDLEPGEHELRFRAAFILDFGLDSSERVEIWSNTVVLTVE